MARKIAAAPGEERLPHPAPRPWQPGDDAAGHIRRIYEEHGLTFDPGFEDDLYDIGRVYRHGQFWIVPDDTARDGSLLATAAAVPDGGVRLIRRMYVAAAARRTGLARMLLDRCLACGPFRRTELWSDVRFREAHALYRGAGFRSGHTRVLDDPDRSVELFFWREG